MLLSVSRWSGRRDLNPRPFGPEAHFITFALFLDPEVKWIEIICTCCSLTRYASHAATPVATASCETDCTKSAFRQRSVKVFAFSRLGSVQELNPVSRYTTAPTPAKRQRSTPISAAVHAADVRVDGECYAGDPRPLQRRRGGDFNDTHRRHRLNNEHEKALRPPS